MNADPVVVIGGGLAGMMAALSLAPRRVVLLLGAGVGEAAASAWAQGGIAAAVGDDDSAEQHAADTLAAGAGLCDAAAVGAIVGEGAATIAALTSLGVGFDRDRSGRLALGLEAAHARRRIVHAGGDGSGREIVRALAVRIAAAAHIEMRPHATARRILLRDREVCGLIFHTAAGPEILATRQIVIATGGVGGLYLATTNPLSATGSGLALAARAGALMADMEFVQFHPTALDVGADPMPLVSEAVRGEGALLINAQGARFMAEVPGRELAPRDVVSRAVWAQIAQGSRVFLDARKALGSGFAVRFPAIAALAQAAGIDPAITPLPIRPAAHYHMGGIATDARGRSSVPGLWACGEAACTGLHGANRLASNSLLEAAVMGQRVARDIASLPAPRPLPVLVESVPAAAAAGIIRPILQRHVGVLRDEAGLARAVAALAPLAAGSDPALVGWMIAAAARARCESRGAHARIDFPRTLAPERRLLRLEGSALRVLSEPFVQAHAP